MSAWRSADARADRPEGDLRARSDSGRGTETPGQGDIVCRMKWQRLAVLSAFIVMLAVILGSASFPWAQTPARQAPAPSSAQLQAIVNQVVGLFPRVSGEVVEVQGTTVT